MDDFFFYAGQATYYTLWGVGWLCTVCGAGLCLGSGFALLRPPTQQRPSPWLDALKMLGGGVVLLQAETLLRWVSESIIADDQLFGRSLGTVDLEEWFQLSAVAGGAARFDMALDLFYGVSATAGFAFFCWGLWRMARAGHSDSNGRPITFSSGAATMLGGAVLTHLPFLLSSLWPSLAHPGI